MRIILTGATGFIGSKLLDEILIHGHEVIALDRELNVLSESAKVRYIQYNIKDELPYEVIDFAPETLIHLVWEGIPDFSMDMCINNVKNQIQFINNIKKLPSLRKVIVSGTCMEYGLKTGICSENDIVTSNTYFSWAKYTLSNFFRIACDESDIKLVWFRLFYIYGLGQRAGSLIPSLFSAFQNGQYPKLNNPTASNDYIYINDVLDAFMLAINSSEIEGIINLGSGISTPAYKISAIVEKLVCKTDVFSKKLESEVEKQNVVPGFFADIKNAETRLGWVPKWNLTNGIEDIYNTFSSLK